MQFLAEHNVFDWGNFTTDTREALEEKATALFYDALQNKVSQEIAINILEAEKQACANVLAATEKYADDEKDLRHNAMQYFMTVQNKLNLLSGKARQSNAIQTDTPSQATVNRIKILDELVNAGQLKYENGTYSITARHMKDFCQWLMQNGYEDITPSLIHEKITPKITEETIRRYMHDMQENQ